MRCILCGHPLVSDTSNAQSGSASVQNFASAQPDILLRAMQAQPQPIAKARHKRQPIATKTEPARSANLQSDFVTPALQNTYIGLLAGATCTLVTDIASASVNLPVTPLQAGLLVGCVSMLTLGYGLVKMHNDSLWRVEEFFGVDINQDGIVGQPQIAGQPQPITQQAPPVFVNRTPGRKDFERFDIPFADLEEAQKVAKAVLVDSKPFTRRALIGCEALPDHPEHYSEIYQAMRNAELLIKGKLTDAGEQYLATFLPTPL